MEHSRAIEENLTERYLLQEMSAADAEQFELHFFECEECANAVETGQALLVNGRAVAAENPVPRERPQSFWSSLAAWWTKPMNLVPVAAALILGAVVLYQAGVVIPGLRQPRILPAFQLIGASRGDAPEIEIPRGAPSFAISADLPPDAHSAQYVCELSFEGRELFELTAPAPAPGQPVTILVPANNLSAGQFALTIYGATPGGQKQDKVSGFVFQLRIR